MPGMGINMSQMASGMDINKSQMASGMATNMNQMTSGMSTNSQMAYGMGMGDQMSGMNSQQVPSQFVAMTSDKVNSMRGSGGNLDMMRGGRNSDMMRSGGSNSGMFQSGGNNFDMMRDSSNSDMMSRFQGGPQRDRGDDMQAGVDGNRFSDHQNEDRIAGADRFGRGGGDRFVGGSALSMEGAVKRTPFSGIDVSLSSDSKKFGRGNDRFGGDNNDHFSNRNSRGSNQQSAQMDGTPRGNFDDVHGFRPPSPRTLHSTGAFQMNDDDMFKSKRSMLSRDTSDFRAQMGSMQRSSVFLDDDYSAGRSGNQASSIGGSRENASMSLPKPVEGNIRRLQNSQSEMDIGRYGGGGNGMRDPTTSGSGNRGSSVVGGRDPMRQGGNNGGMGGYGRTGFGSGGMPPMMNTSIER